MIRLLVLLFALHWSSIGHASEKLSYYGFKSDKEALVFAHSPQFRNQLQDILESEHHPLSYTQARRVLFGELHLKQDHRGYYVSCVYCEDDYHEDDFNSQPPGPWKIPDANKLNTEHTWPQSKFTSRHSKGTQKTDLHALFPTNSSANSSRGNSPFGEVIGKFKLICGTSRRGDSALGGGSVFEPPPQHRGNVARALFYFAIRYELRISNSEETFLRAWHEQDPVDAEEEWRNQRVFEIQGVRNPFIDHPVWTDSIPDF